MGLSCFLAILQVSMKFPSYGLVYDYSLEDGGVSRKHNKDDDDEDHHTEEVRGQICHFIDLTRAERHYMAKFQTFCIEIVFRFQFVEDCMHSCVALRIFNDLKRFCWTEVDASM